MLGDPVRRRILELLADGEQPAGTVTGVIQREFGISQPAVSQHLRVLRESGFATVRADGARRLYAVDAAPLREVDVWLDHFRQFWTQRLDALGTELARGRRERRTKPSHEEGGRHVIDIVDQINATHREIGNHPVGDGEGRSLLLRRTYDAPIEDVWSACTNPDRISRWLAPIDGDLRLGGAYQLKDNASGTILRCEEPHLIKVTWALGEGMLTEVEVRLARGEAGGTVMELEHSSPAEIVDELVRSYGPGGTIGIGGGWDLTLLGLDLFLRGAEFDPATWEDTPEAKDFATRSCHAWGPVIQAAWGTSDDDIGAAIAFGVQHFAPEPEAAGSPDRQAST